MMIYLKGSKRLDISYAVHQCAQFFHAPKRSHEIRVNHIDRYLKGTRTKGLVMKPDLKNLQLDLFADTDFTILFPIKTKQDIIIVKIRTGLLLKFGGVPILWSSKLQSEISLSTLEAEYTALSCGMRELVAW